MAQTTRQRAEAARNAASPWRATSKRKQRQNDANTGESPEQRARREARWANEDRALDREHQEIWL